MASYNYYEEVRNDVVNAISDYDLSEYKGDRDGFESLLNDDLWLNDSVTGNSSGSYTFNRYRAREYVLDNVDLLEDMCLDFGVSAEEVGEHFLNGDWEYFDVLIRCYLLSGAISEVLDDMEENGDFDEEEENEENEEILGTIA